MGEAVSQSVQDLGIVLVNLGRGIRLQILGLHSAQRSLSYLTESSDFSRGLRGKFQDEVVVL